MAIKAHLDQPAQGQNLRGAPRRALRLEASGTLPDGQEANVRLHNISAAGLLLETAIDLAAGEELTLDLPEAGQVAARIIWSSEGLYGCAFVTPLNAGALAAAQLQGLPVEHRAPPVATTGAGAKPPEALATRLGRLRREAGLTLADVANRLSVSKPTVWAWEKGKARPLPERMEAIAEALGVPSAELAETGTPDGDAGLVIEECRKRIAEACNTRPDTVRILIEL
ncbi:helix-turn-helix domain-containing protein [Erythrobacter dokdonensis]|uniref:XRE family transcriptional regulator n=1 Tax=Erythrobacter dokdonensis DSW-74 TaxID=1300349 RepID=A0A1A7BF66_9SPHN|nr:helix-turn-helix domain-containing protein [Erythrobacter dokdonensis]OBV11168.1 XRE family transcriptional regulator [Erythrobacter dokdonensis DSW-74]